MLITCHWSATGPQRLHDYHVEFGYLRPLSSADYHAVATATKPADVNFTKLSAAFDVYKNVAFDTATTYGTYLLNHDPRDETPNIEVGALCMGGEDVQVAGSWGATPFTYAHAWMMAAIVARVAKLKNIAIGGSFAPALDAGVLQNGPIYNVSTHAERAWQTNDQGADTMPERGYFIYSGDPDSRWDLSALDSTQSGHLSTYAGAIASARTSAGWIRTQAAAIAAGPIADYWGLDKDAT